MSASRSGPSTPEEYFRFGLYRFRSPLLTVSISLSFPPLTEMFHFSGCRVHKPMYSAYDDKVLSLSGYPIRIPPGLSSLAALRGFSQLVASFFACQHQGIHHKPLGSLYKVQPPVTRIPKSFSRLIQSFANLLFLCMLDSYVICVSALHLEIVISHKIVGVAAFAAIYNFATRMSICRLPADFSIPCWRGKRAGCL